MKNVTNLAEAKDFFLNNSSGTVMCSDGKTSKEINSFQEAEKFFEPTVDDSNEQVAVQREQTFGEKAVGLSFNPSGDSGVNRIKELYAEIIDILNDFKTVEASNMSSGEHRRLASIGITEAQGSQMWAVKALTWRDKRD